MEAFTAGLTWCRFRACGGNKNTAFAGFTAFHRLGYENCHDATHTPAPVADINNKQLSPFRL
jgi:hypothetical protein